MNDKIRLIVHVNAGEAGVDSVNIAVIT